MRYQSDYSNQVHQLLVSVSKHYLVGAKNQIRYQKKTMDVSLKNFEKSKKVHLVYYILRDHFSGFYYVEVTTTKNMIPLQDFILRGFLPKLDVEFYGMPDVLMIPKQVEDHFLPIDEILSEMKIQKIHPPSGFASGMIAVKNWERHMKVPLALDEGFKDMNLWNPRTPIRYCKMFNEDNLTKWKYGISEIKIPSSEYVSKKVSDEFNFAEDYTLHTPLWEKYQKSKQHTS